MTTPPAVDSDRADRLSRPTPTVWLSGAEAAEYVGVSSTALRQFIREPLRRPPAGSRDGRS